MTHLTENVKALLTLGFVILLMSGCATDPFAKYYQGYTNQMPAYVHQRLLPPSPNPHVITASANTFKDEEQRLQERGLVVLGSSSFYGFNPTQQQLTRQAKKVGADVAVWASDYSHSQQGVMPLMSYQPGQTYTTTHSGVANVNARGDGGYATASGTYSGTTTTTTPATVQTDYLPYERRIYNHAASFWRHTKQAVFGATMLPLPDELRRKLQRNTGAYVQFVRLGSPAFKADILQGDTIIQANGELIASPEELVGFLSTHAGQTVTMRMLRGEKTVQVQVKLNEQE